jgi:hypothetical protein
VVDGGDAHADGHDPTGHGRRLGEGLSGHPAPQIEHVQVAHPQDVGDDREAERVTLPLRRAEHHRASATSRSPEASAHARDRARRRRDRQVAGSEAVGRPGPAHRLAHHVDDHLLGIPPCHQGGLHLDPGTDLVAHHQPRPQPRHPDEEGTPEAVGARELRQK